MSERNTDGARRVIRALRKQRDARLRAEATTTCADHTPCDYGYVDKSRWAEQMLAAGKTQHICGECGLWLIWRDGRGIVRRRIEVDDE